MPFRIIKGTFHVVGYSPDGDSIRFKADNNDNWDLLSGPPAVLNGRGHAQLRLEAIDTLETHFGNSHQPLTLATRAIDFLLRSLNITGVEWDVLRTRVTKANDGTRGYVVTRAVERNGRPVSFVFAGAAPKADGREVYLDVPLLRKSVNYKSVEAGLAYPTYYQGLFSDLRQGLTEATARARKAGREIWAVDRTTAGFEVRSLASITEQHVILPKLFRRLAEYLEGGGSVRGFKEFLARKRERVTIISSSHFTHFDTVVEVRGRVVRMTEPPENLVFEG
jgi:endonuclease YncB( thermonuclease family)